LLTIVPRQISDSPKQNFARKSHRVLVAASVDLTSEEFTVKYLQVLSMRRQNTTKLKAKTGRQRKEQSDNQRRECCKKELRLEREIATETQNGVRHLWRLVAENSIRLLQF
jgi:hypothetical protein